MGTETVDWFGFGKRNASYWAAHWLWNDAARIGDRKPYAKEKAKRREHAKRVRSQKRHMAA